MPKLSSTSALVLLWVSNECYKSKNAKDYLKLLDLTAGNNLYKECIKIWPFYDEVIKNRKLGVLNLIKDSLTTDKDIKQMIIAGAGLDALSIEVLQDFPKLKIFELDVDNMEIKANLFAKINSLTKSKISFVTVNLSNTNEVKIKLLNNGWNPEEPTLLILEGISYYLSPNSIQELFTVIKPRRTVLEFLKESEGIISERMNIADQVFNLISEECDCKEIIRYDYSKIENLFAMATLTKLSMKELEKQRRGSNKHFPTEKSGWIEICLLGDKNSNSS